MNERSISAVGTSVSDYDRVIFSVSVGASGETGPEAKERARPLINLVNKALEDLEYKGVNFERERMITSFQVNKTESYNHKTGKSIFNGYQADYKLKIESGDVKRVSEIHDALTSLSGVEVDSPSFKILDLTSRHNAAFKDGVVRAQELFRAECAVLGKSVDNYKITSWNVHYDNSQSSSPKGLMYMSAGAESVGAPLIKVDSGKAEVTARVTLDFSLRS